MKLTLTALSMALALGAGMAQAQAKTYDCKVTAQRYLLVINSKQDEGHILMEKMRQPGDADSNAASWELDSRPTVVTSSGQGSSTSIVALDQSEVNWEAPENQGRCHVIRESMRFTLSEQPRAIGGIAQVMPVVYSNPAMNGSDCPPPPMALPAPRPLRCTDY